MRMLFGGLGKFLKFGCYLQAFTKIVQIQMERILDYFTLKNTITELENSGKNVLADKVQEIIKNFEIPKSENHNRIKDIETSKFKIVLTDDEIIEITDLFSDLEVSSLSENYEATNLTNYYVQILDNWNNLLEN